VWPGADLLSSARSSRDPAAPRPPLAGGHIVLSHPLGRGWHADFRRGAPALAPHGLPNAARLAALAAGLPLTVRALADEDAQYLALLQARRGPALPYPNPILPCPAAAEAQPRRPGGEGAVACFAWRRVREQRCVPAWRRRAEWGPRQVKRAALLCEEAAHHRARAEALGRGSDTLDGC
jgi:hypothetical protein